MMRRAGFGVIAACWLVFAGCGNSGPGGSAGAGSSGIGGDPSAAGRGGALSGAGLGGVGGSSFAATAGDGSATGGGAESGAAGFGGGGGDIAGESGVGGTEVGGTSGGTGVGGASGGAGIGGTSGGAGVGGTSGSAGVGGTSGGTGIGGTSGGAGVGGSAGVSGASGGAPPSVTPVGEAFWPQQNLLDIHMDTAWDLPSPLVGTVSPNLGVKRVYTCLIDNGAQSFTGGGGNDEIVRPGNFGWDIGGVAAATLGGPTAPGAAEGGHGTACAGIVGADWQTESGVVGIAPLGSLFSLALGRPAVVSDVTAAINAAVGTVLPNADPVGTAERDKQHRRVILLSVFHNAYAVTPALSTAIANALAADVPVIIPTGDGDTSTIPYPATDPGVIVCGAVRPFTGARVSAEPLGHGTNNGGPSWGSNYSSTQPFVSAPGFALKSTDLNGAQGYTATNYVTDFQGTSAAAAHVAGLAALLLAHNPRLTASDVRTIIYRTAEKVGGTFSPSDAKHPDGTWNQNVGYGRINAQSAVIEARRVRAEVTEITGADPGVIEFGTVQPGTTAQIVIRLRHATTLCTHPITFVLPTVLPAHVQWAPGTPASIVLASGATQTVTLQYVAPSTAVEVSGTIQFLSDDFLARSIALSVHAS